MVESQDINPPCGSLDRREKDISNSQGDDHSNCNIEHI